MYKRIIFSLLLLSMYSAVFAQQPEMAFDMRSSGKIYVVVAVLAVIFIGLFIHLILLDRRISRLEKARKEHKIS
jgi:hydrogenase-4 membrane subunit HyfE